MKNNVMFYTKLKANLSGREKCDLKSSKFLKIKVPRYH